MNQPTVVQACMRATMGFGAGLMGIMILGIILLFSWSTMGEVLFGGTAGSVQEALSSRPSSVFLYITLLGIFLSTLCGSLMYVLILSHVEPNMKSCAFPLMTQLFWGHIIILLLIGPVYLLINTQYSQQVILIASFFHLLLSVIFTYLVSELWSQGASFLLSIYGLVVGLIFFMLVVGAFGFPILYFSQPFLMASVCFSSIFTRILHGSLVSSYGVDLLNSGRNDEA